MATVNPGYMGWAKFGSASEFRFSDCSVAAKQDINAPDLVNGHWNRQAYNYGKVEIGGSISGPVGERFAGGGASSFWGRATTRSACGELTGDTLVIHYYCGTSGNGNASFAQAKVNSMTFSCAAGEVAQFSSEIIGAGAPTWTTATTGSLGVSTAEKLITWDKVSLSVTAGTVSSPSIQTFGADKISNFSITYANNITAVYALGTGDLFPYTLVDGLTNITGNISIYNIPSMFGANKYDDYLAGGVGTITFNVGAGPLTVNVRWHRIEPTLSPGPIISTIAFTGVVNA